MIVILLHVLIELEYVFKMLLWKRAKARLQITGLIKGLLYTTNLNEQLHEFVSLH